MHSQRERTLDGCAEVAAKPLAEMDKRNITWKSLRFQETLTAVDLRPVLYTRHSYKTQCPRKCHAVIIQESGMLASNHTNSLGGEGVTIPWTMAGVVLGCSSMPPKFPANISLVPSHLGGEKRPGIHCMCMHESFSKFSVKSYVKSQSQKLACTEVNYKWSTR